MTRALALAAVLLCACAPTQLRYDALPAHCQTPDPVALAQAARQSLVLVPYHPRALYDVDGRGGAVPLRAGSLPPDALAVLSYPDPQRFAGGNVDFARMAQRSFVYDDALTALWLAHDGDLARARRVLATLAALQNPDGTWGFGFNTGADDGFYNAGYVRTGTVAWALYAFAHYEKLSGDKQFAATVQRGVAWLLRQQDPATGLFYAGAGRWRDPGHFEPSWPARFFATEHQIDVWFALQALAPLRPALPLTQRAQTLREALFRRLWLPAEQRFAQGLSATGSVDGESALDASGTWAALWLLAVGDPARAAQALAWVATRHGTTAQGWPGLRPYLAMAPDTWFVEGSIAQPLALARLGQPVAAHWQPLLQLACAGGLPVVYAPDWHADFPLSPATAPTIWWLIAAQELQPQSAPWLWAER